MHKNKKAFTLIELLVVVLIIGILSAIALPQYNLAVEKARATEALVVLKSIKDAQELYYMENGHYCESANKDDLGITIPESKYWTYTINAGPNQSTFATRKNKDLLLFYRFSHQTSASVEPDSIACGWGASSPTDEVVAYTTRMCKALGATGTGSRMIIKF